MREAPWQRIGSWSQIRNALASILAVTVIATPAARSLDGASEPVLRVEEDWQLVLNEPNEDADCPQFHTVMSPTNGVDGYYAQTLWNYREVPDYRSGGVQLRSWHDELLLRRRSVEYRTLSTTAETITWTQALEANDSELTFSITNGNSTTWGTFGRDMVIDVPTGIVELNSYDPAVSAENSCITYGSNRVESLTITAVRYYGLTGLLYEDTAPRAVYQLGDHESDGE